MEQVHDLVKCVWNTCKASDPVDSLGLSRSIPSFYVLSKHGAYQAIKTDLRDEEVKLILKALEHCYASTRATQRDDSRY